MGISMIGGVPRDGRLPEADSADVTSGAPMVEWSSHDPATWPAAEPGVVTITATGSAGYYRVAFETAGNRSFAVWQAESDPLGWDATAQVVPTVANENGHFYSGSLGGGGNGLTGASEPTWPTNGGTVIDGDWTWTDMGTYAGSGMGLVTVQRGEDPGDITTAFAAEDVGATANVTASGTWDALVLTHTGGGDLGGTTLPDVLDEALVGGTATAAITDSGRDAGLYRPVGSTIHMTTGVVKRHASATLSDWVEM